MTQLYTVILINHIVTSDMTRPDTRANQCHINTSHSLTQSVQLLKNSIFHKKNVSLHSFPPT